MLIHYCANNMVLNSKYIMQLRKPAIRSALVIFFEKHNNVNRALQYEHCAFYGERKLAKTVIDPSVCYKGQLDKDPEISLIASYVF